jgi:hypothetical protein
MIEEPPLPQNKRRRIAIRFNRKSKFGRAHGDKAKYEALKETSLLTLLGWRRHDAVAPTVT